MKDILYIVWNEGNNLGISIIDEQHRGLISTINSLYYFIQAGRGNETIDPTMIMLKQYTNVHFRTEEALMAEAGYPAIQEHIALHRELSGKTMRFSIDVNRSDDPDILLKFLKEWWLGHINKEDRKYAPFLKKLKSQQA